MSDILSDLFGLFYILCFTPHPMISQSISFIVIRNDCSSFSRSTDSIYHPLRHSKGLHFASHLTVSSTIKMYNIFRTFQRRNKVLFIIMLKMLKLYKFYYSLDYLKNLHSPNILFQFCKGSHFYDISRY